MSGTGGLRSRLPRNVRHRLRTAAAVEALKRAGPTLNLHVIGLDYPPNRKNEPRYIAAIPALGHRITDGEDRYRSALFTIGAHTADLARIPIRANDDLTPSWANGFLPGLDSAAIYSFLRTRKPARYVEIGSGNSTKFAARARVDGKLGTHLTSIDPHPRAEVDQLCDTVIRAPLETIDLALFTDLTEGDVVFMDGSHRVFMNNDVVAFVLEALPALPAGVLVGVHDVYLPFDYPADIAGRYYSEQYMLAAYLLGNDTLEVTLPAHYASTVMRQDVDAIWASSPAFVGVEPHGVAFWMETHA